MFWKDLPETTFRYSIILPHSKAKRILVLPEGEGWTLPYWETNQPEFWQAVTLINKVVMERFGLEVVTVRCLENDSRPDLGLVERFYELESLDSFWTTACGCWLGREDLDQMTSLRQRLLLERWFDGLTIEQSAKMKPWTRPGWFESARVWIETQMERLNLHRSGPIEQLRHWERGCILRIPSNVGSLYFKALPSISAQEMFLTQYLSQWYPQHIIRILAIEPEQLWMLSADMEGQALYLSSDVFCWQRALHLFATIQIKSAAYADELTKLKCPDRRLDTFISQIEPFLTYLPGGYALSTEEVLRLQALTSALKEHAQRLASYEIPVALEHGDFWAGNVMVTQEKNYIYFDWSDSSLSHPFFSLTRLLELEVGPETLLCVPRLRDLLRDAYLQPWTAYEPMTRLIEAFELAQKLVPLHHALTLHEFLLPALAAKWELEHLVSFYLRLLLRYNS